MPLPTLSTERKRKPRQPTTYIKNSGFGAKFKGHIFEQSLVLN